MSKIADLQTALKTAIDDTPMLAAAQPEPITALIDKGPDIETKINESIQRGIGICILIGGAALRPLGESTELPRYATQVRIAIAQQPTLDTSGIELLDAVEAILTRLHNAPQTTPNRTRLWRVIDVGPMEDAEVFAYQVTIETALLFS